MVRSNVSTVILSPASCSRTAESWAGFRDYQAAQAGDKRYVVMPDHQSAFNTLLHALFNQRTLKT